MTKVIAIECPQCGYIIYSRARHDFRSCKCGDCNIDGGFDYVKIGAMDLSKIQQHELEIPITRTELYDDWNNQTDNYGSVAPCGKPLSSSSWAASSLASSS